MYRKKKPTSTPSRSSADAKETNDESFLTDLNAEQKRAVMCAINQSTLVLSGAGLSLSFRGWIADRTRHALSGSGKTRVLTSRIAYLLKNSDVKPYQIFAVTFTNKAAMEMRHRISGMLPGVQLKEMWLGTFHGLGDCTLSFVLLFIEAFFVL